MSTLNKPCTIHYAGNVNVAKAVLALIEAQLTECRWQLGEKPTQFTPEYGTALNLYFNCSGKPRLSFTPPGNPPTYQLQFNAATEFGKLVEHLTSSPATVPAVARLSMLGHDVSIDASTGIKFGCTKVTFDEFDKIMAVFKAPASSDDLKSRDCIIVASNAEESRMVRALVREITNKSTAMSDLSRCAGGLAARLSSRRPGEYGFYSAYSGGAERYREHSEHATYPEFHIRGDFGKLLDYLSAPATTKITLAHEGQVVTVIPGEHVVSQGITLDQASIDRLVAAVKTVRGE